MHKRLELLIYIHKLGYKFDMYSFLGALGGIASGGLFFYCGYQYNTFIQELNRPKKVLLPTPEHTFLPETISTYCQRKNQDGKLIIHSNLHKCPLSVHQIIRTPVIKQDKIQTVTSNQQKVKTTQQNEVKESIANEKDDKINNNQEYIRFQKRNQALFNKIFKQYASDLLTRKVCNSAELISGPIFSKDTPYKLKDQNIKNVFTSNIKVKNGEWLTDRYYTIVICNRDQGSYYTPFSYRKSGQNNFKFISYLTSLKKLQEQTGLVFNIKGKQLTLIQFGQLSKERFFDEQKQESKINSSEKV